MATTVRADFTAAIMTVLQAQVAATPTLLRGASAARPGSFPETPWAYIGAKDETISSGAAARGYGLRDRTFSGLTVVLVDTLADPIAQGDRMDDLVDALVDRFDAAYAAVAGGILQLSSVTDTDVEVAGTSGPIYYRGSILGFARTFKSEGRT